MSMKKSIYLWFCTLVLAIAGLSSCSSDDDILSPEEKSVCRHTLTLGIRIPDTARWAL